MTYPDYLREVSAKARRLADDHACPEDIRKMAGEVVDLSALMATWPVPPALNLDEELKRRLLGLCRQSGNALCGMRRCLAKDSATGGSGCDLLLRHA